MLRTVIEKEIRDLIGSAKFAGIFGVCALLIVASFYIGASQYKVNQEQYSAAQSANVRQMEGLTDWLRVSQHRIFLPPSPIATLVSGISNDIGRTTEILKHRELVARDSKFGEEPIFAVFRFLDLEFIFGLVLSLFAILLGYNAISGEKENGTLRLVLANPIPRPTYIIGKLLGSFLALSVSLVIAFVAGCLLLPLMGVPMNASDWLRLSLIILTGLLYFGAFLTISIFVSSWTHRSSSSFMLLLVFWIMSSMILPRVSVLMAGRAVDVPSVDQHDAEKARYAAQLWSESREAMSGFTPPEGDSEDPEHMQAVVTGFQKYMDSLTTVRSDLMAEFSDRLDEKRRNAQGVQQKLAFFLARISPTTSLRLATTALAGTSLDLKDRYRQQAIGYRKSVMDFMEEKTGMNMSGGGIYVKIGDEEEEEPIDPSEMPVFTFTPSGIKPALAGAVVDMGLLAFLNLIFLAGAVTAFTRYDVR